MIGGLGGVGPASPTGTRPTKGDQASGLGGPSFGEVLGSQIAEPKPNNLAPKTEGLKFSQHALERMKMRGISFKPEDMGKLNEAIDRAAQKGSRETLVLMGDNALIVSVKNKTVVTAMDREAMKEKVFSNIDSTVIL
ncbi:MAG: hypothetical protein IT289_08840 [Oligoflexia bacterium]|nr:hypothetical protein [Oligoflexia bacterium]